MKTYITLLRGINVSGKNKIKMADLRDLLQAAGFEQVQTYIQSGNILLQSNKTEAEVSDLVRSEIERHYGYQIAVMSFDQATFESFLAHNPFYEEHQEDLKYLHTSMLAATPTIGLEKLEAKRAEHEKMALVGRALYFYCPKGYGTSKLSNNAIETALKIKATTRNQRTMLKLQDLLQNNEK